MPIYHLFVFFGERYYLGLVPISWLVCLFFAIEPYVYLYILEMNPLSVVITCNYILQFCRLTFCFVYCFLCCSKAFKFIYVPFVNFCFYFFYSRGYILKGITVIYVKSVLPRSFMISSLTFRYLIHLRFIFVCDVSVLISFFYM